MNICFLSIHSRGCITFYLVKYLLLYILSNNMMGLIALQTVLRPFTANKSILYDILSDAVGKTDG